MPLEKRADASVRHATLLIAAVTLVSLSVFAAIHRARAANGDPAFLFADYLVFWSSGPALHHGGLAELFDVHAFTALQNDLFANILPRRISARPWLYPPPFLLFARGFSALPFFASAMLFQAAGAIALWFATGRKWWPFLLLVASPAFGSIVDAGQLSAWIAAGIVGGVLLLESAPIAAGLLFGVVSIKPHLFVLLPLALIAARQWRAFAACAATATLLMSASLGVFGLDAWRLWLNAATGPAQLVSSGSQWVTTYGIQMGSVLSTVRMLGGGATLAWSAQALCMLLSGAAVWFTFARSSDRSQRAIAITLSALLCAPYWMNYDLILPCAAITVAAARAMRSGFRHGEELSWLMLWMLPYAMLFVQALWHVPTAPFVVLGALLLTLRHVAVEARAAKNVNGADVFAPLLPTPRASIATLHAATAASRT